jgi:hypothetical protein
VNTNNNNTNTSTLVNRSVSSNRIDSVKPATGSGKPNKLVDEKKATVKSAENTFKENTKNGVKGPQPPLGQVDLNKGPLKKQRIEPTVARTNSKVTK